MSMTSHYRKLLFKKWSRLLHIYLSMLGLLAILFFSITGIMLNHEEWFGYAEPRVSKHEGTLPAALLAGPDKLGIVEKLRKDFGATGALDSFDVHDDELALVFKSPGRRTEATITRTDGHAEVSVETHGFAGRFVELHRGTEAGPAWRLVIDATAILLLLSSVTGLVLWLLVPKWRPLGIAALVVSALVCAAIYLAFVP
jgi:hypothetical protein